MSGAARRRWLERPSLMTVSLLKDTVLAKKYNFFFFCFVWDAEESTSSTKTKSSQPHSDGGKNAASQQEVIWIRHDRQFWQ